MAALPDPDRETGEKTVDIPDPEPETRVAHELATRIAVEEREEIRAWLEELLEIRASNVPARVKAKRAIKATAKKSIAVAIAKELVESDIGNRIKHTPWTDRSWAFRIGIPIAAATAVATGGAGAGIAALGGAVGVPLWIVLGAGGSFAGMLIDELSGRRHAVVRDVTPKSQGDSRLPEAIDAEHRLIEDENGGELPPGRRALPPTDS